MEEEEAGGLPQAATCHRARPDPRRPALVLGAGDHQEHRTQVFILSDGGMLESWPDSGRVCGQCRGLRLLADRRHQREVVANGAEKLPHLRLDRDETRAKKGVQRDECEARKSNDAPRRTQALCRLRRLPRRCGK